MRKIPLVVAFASFLLLAVSESVADTFNVTVPAKPEWTETSVSVAPGDTFSITATGAWSIDTCCTPLFGPDGMFHDLGLLGNTNGFISDPKLTGALIGAIAPPGQNDDYFKSLGQDNPTFFVAGSNLSFFSATVAGKLYLGFNDFGLPDNQPATNDNTGSVSATITIPAPTQSVPVVLVHGWCGSPASFGQLKQTLLNDADAFTDAVLEFDYAGDRSLVPRFERKNLIRLAARLGQSIKDWKETLGASQVDVVAHSMGGLLVRAWMAGLTEPVVPYSNEIRRLVLAGSPNFGVSSTFLTLGPEFCDEDVKAVRVAQEKAMFFGSEFLKALNVKWDGALISGVVLPRNILTIVGCGSGNLPGGECNGDVVVNAASATLPPISPQAKDYHVRWINRNHFSSLVEIDGGTHETYVLIKEFFRFGTAVSPVPGGVAGSGLVVVPLIEDLITGEPFTKTEGMNFSRSAKPDCAVFDPDVPVPPFFKPSDRTGWWTFTGVHQGCWEIQVSSKKYSSGLGVVPVTAGRPKITEPLLVCKKNEPCQPPPPPPPGG